MLFKNLKSFVGMCLISTQLLMISSAFAKSGGSMDGGGGDSVSVNKTEDRLLDLVEIGELKYVNPREVINSHSRSYYNFIVSDFIIKNSLGAFKVNDDRYMFNYFILRSLGEVNLSIPALADRMVHTPAPMIFYFSNDRLDELNDEGKIHIEEAYDKTQLAIQNEEGRVVIYKPLFDKLSKKDQAALIMHEVLLRFVWQYNPDHLKEFGTEKIRKLNRQLIGLLSKEFIPQDEIVKSLKDLGVKTLSKPLVF